MCNRRERGMAIIPIVVPKFPLSFLLCFRGLSADDSHHIFDTGSVMLQTAYTVAIRHCPWCGADLRSFYSNRVDRLPVIKVGDDAISSPDVVFALVDKSEEVVQRAEGKSP